MRSRLSCHSRRFALKGHPDIAPSHASGAGFGSLLVKSLRLVALVLLVGELIVTATIQRPDLLHPDLLGSDPSNYLAAAERINAGHPLYGPLQPDDLQVPGYPEIFPAPLLSPPLVPILWRPLVVLTGALSTYLWWLVGFLLLVDLIIAFVLAGRAENLAALVAVFALGFPLALIGHGTYPYPGFDSPVSFAALSGNVNTYVVALFALTWWASSRGHPLLSGTSAALAAALKLGPAVLLWWFVTQRLWRSALAFIVGGIAFGVIGVVSPAYRRTWTSSTWQSEAKSSQPR